MTTVCNDCRKLCQHQTYHLLYINTIEQLWFLCNECFDYNIRNSQLLLVKEELMYNTYTMSQYMIYMYSKKIKKELTDLSTVYELLKKNFVSNDLSTESDTTMFLSN